MAPIAATTIGQVLLAAAARWPQRDALVFPGIRRTFGQLERGAWSVARALHALGVRRGDHVGILMPNCVEMVQSLFGAALVGAVVCPVNARYRSAELAYVVADAEHRVLVTSDIVDEHVDYAALIQRALPGLAHSDPARLELEEAPALRQVVVLGSREAEGMIGSTSFRELSSSVSQTEVEHMASELDVGDSGLILYTSGTTANPKGCVLSHEAIVGGSRSVGTRERVTERDVCWDPLPLYHTSGLQPLLYTLDSGGRFISMTHFEPGPALAQIRDENVTVLKSTFPPVTMAVIDHPEFLTLDVSRIRVVQIVAPPETLRRVQAAFPAAAVQGAYGLCEAGGYVAVNELDEEFESRLHTVGPPFPGIEVRAVDAAGRDVAAGEPGELLVRGFTLLQRYQGDPQRTAEVIDDDGWLHTGDRGTVDAQGAISFLGRMKEMIRVGGENVAPAEIEGHLSTHPAVHLVQAVGVPDERLEEVPAAFVQLKPGVSASERELIDFCVGQIASFKVPRYIRIVDHWPTSATKIQRFRLRERLLAELASRESPAAGGDSPGNGDIAPGGDAKPANIYD